MSQQVEFLFDFGSPMSYLAYCRLPGLAERTGAGIIWTPMLLGGVFKATGNRSPGEVPAKGAYMQLEIARACRRHDIAFNRNPHFPVNTLQIMRGAVAYQMQGDFTGYVKCMFESMWLSPRNLNEPDELAAALQGGGFDPNDFLERIGRQEVKDRLIANTEGAVARGVFGAPTFFVDGEMFFGQDRLPEVEEELAA
ncbi:MAG: 2-hydroxychromene-2-carboxylate isomerase [Alphaproteobacteria bacterium]|jgi:2-hydroxychromene-2-carboxylate isomerase|nr:2-hydroxychromene-2-carboxylate isomerase [Alphaproteobacteria bacterium]MDP6567897.1 2-hydroxychromene-2-carboxylate isomerase [Alphaproteobacteria bacterium]MDP6812404.1 2-hydroxychromene-2-carboxylate isomerase [Alphaproteobacteria bacterium]